MVTYETSNNEEKHTEPSIFSDVLKFKKVKEKIDTSNPDQKLVSSEAFNKQNENDEEKNKASNVKKVTAKVDCRRKNWSKEQQDLMLEEWRKQRGFKWDQTQKETNIVRHTDNRYNVRIFACVRFNKCAVLYTHAS